MSTLFAVQAVVLVFGGYLIGVGYFRKKWTPVVPERKACRDAHKAAIGAHVSCEGPNGALRIVNMGLDPSRWEIIHCKECSDWAKAVSKAKEQRGNAWFWPVVGIGKASMAVVHIGESLADTEVHR